MRMQLFFDKIRKASLMVQKHDINFTDEIFVISKEQLLTMKKVSQIFIKLMEYVYKSQEYYNLDLPFITKIKNLPIPKLTFSPMRLDFLQKDEKLILSDVNLPGSLVPDIFWAQFGIKKERKIYDFFNKKYTAFNAYYHYNKIITKFLNRKAVILRFLEHNTVKSHKQRKFLEALYKLIDHMNLINLVYMDDEINHDLIYNLPSDKIISIFLNTHNSPENLYSSIKELLTEDRPIFVNPKLLPFTDKKPPSLEILTSFLSDNEAEYLFEHLPSLKSNNKINKIRFGHSASSYIKSTSTDNYYLYPQIELEKLNSLQFQGFIEHSKTNEKYKDHLCEISINTFIVTQGNEFKDYNECVSVSSRGSLSHPISGPHTLLFPTIAEGG
jgi:hypothetical protein